MTNPMPIAINVIAPAYCWPIIPGMNTVRLVDAKFEHVEPGAVVIASHRQDREAAPIAVEILAVRSVVRSTFQRIIEAHHEFNHMQPTGPVEFRQMLEKLHGRRIDDDETAVAIYF